MSATFNAELYASKNKSAKADFYAEIYAAADPLLYKVDENFDTKRIVKNDNPQIKIEFDTRRALSNIVIVEADTKRKLISAIEVELKADTKRIITSEIITNFDTKRIVESNLLQVLAFFDTKRSKTSGVYCEFDTNRIKTSIITVESDTLREIKDIVYQVELAFDLRLEKTYTNYFYYGTLRRLGFTVTLNADTKRTIGKDIGFECDTKRQILLDLGILPRANVSTGVQNVNLTIQTGTLSDTFTLTGINKIYPKDVVEGVLLDFPYHFQAEETKEEGILFSVTKTSYNSGKMLYTLLNYTLKYLENHEYINWEGKTIYGKTVSDHCYKVAEALGLEYHWRGGNKFIPKSDSSDSNVTYQSILSTLFSWSNNIPRKKYIVIIRNKTHLYVLQRGQETGNINLDEYKWFNYPVYVRRQIRTQWMKKADNNDGFIGVKSPMIYHVPPKGIDEIMGYHSTGSDYLTADTESVERHDGSGKTDNRLTYTKKTNPDGSTTTTTYDYIDTGKNYVIKTILEITEKESGTDPTTGVIVQGYKNTRRTEYSYLPSGVRHTDVYENNIKIEESEQQDSSFEETNHTASSFDRVRPGDEGNDFLDDQTYLAHGSSWKTQGSSTGNSFLNDSEVPVKDKATIDMYWEELEWMDRAIEEVATLTITVPVKKGVIADEDNHVFDFFDTYTLNGKTYYLESNSVSITPRSIKQQLTLIRWYK